MTRRVALVTGASRGIGRAIALRLAQDGFDLTISARSAEALRDTDREARRRGAAVQSVPANMTSEEEVRALARAHIQFHSSLDLLVLCAGTGHAAELAGYPVSQFDRQFATNLRGPFILVQHLLPALRKAAAAKPELGSRVVAIASITGVVPEPGLAVYGATKAALISLCGSITEAEQDNGVSATAISPGYVDTDMSGWVRDRIPPSAMIKADDVAELVSGITRLSRQANVPNVVVTRSGAGPTRA